MRHRHTVVWLDHYEAIVMNVHPDGGESLRISSGREPEHRQLHRKSGLPGDGHQRDDVEFFGRVARALGESEVVLLTGPGLAKTSFMSFLHRRACDVAERVAAVETLDHPTEGQLLRHAQAYFKRLQGLGTL